MTQNIAVEVKLSPQLSDVLGSVLSGERKTTASGFRPPWLSPKPAAMTPAELGVVREEKEDTKAFVKRVEDTREALEKKQKAIAAARKPHIKEMYRLTEKLVGAVGAADVAQLWREPGDPDTREWADCIDPKYQSVIDRALLDVREYSPRTDMWKIAADSTASAQFAKFVEFHYSNSKISTKNTYRQLDGKSYVINMYYEAVQFFKTF